MRRHTKVFLAMILIAALSGCRYPLHSAAAPATATVSQPTESISTPSTAPTPDKTIVSDTPLTPTPSPSPAETPTPTDKPGTITVHFIDVGKADSILVKAGSSAMLIDAGTQEMGSTVVDYLKSQGVTKLDYIIGTHSHIDHIGGMAAVLDVFPVKKFLMPKVPDTGEIYQELLHTLDENKINWVLPKVGKQYSLGAARFTILAPNGTGYKNFNDYSIVIRLAFGKTSFLFAGDALKTSEDEMLANHLPLSSTLLKVGHHGGSTSSSVDFLKAVNPRFAVISTDTSRKGYPSDKILKRLASMGIQVYRTDEDGTIIATSDGMTITLDKQPSNIIVDPTKTPKGN